MKYCKKNLMRVAALLGVIYLLGCGSGSSGGGGKDTPPVSANLTGCPFPSEVYPAHKHPGARGINVADECRRSPVYKKMESLLSLDTANYCFRIGHAVKRTSPTSCYDVKFRYDTPCSESEIVNSFADTLGGSRAIQLRLREMKRDGFTVDQCGTKNGFPVVFFFCYIAEIPGASASELPCIPQAEILSENRTDIILKSRYIVGRPTE